MKRTPPIFAVDRTTQILCRANESDQAIAIRSFRDPIQGAYHDKRMVGLVKWDMCNDPRN